TGKKVSTLFLDLSTVDFGHYADLKSKSPPSSPRPSRARLNFAPSNTRLPWPRRPTPWQAEPKSGSPFVRRLEKGQIAAFVPGDAGLPRAKGNRSLLWYSPLPRPRRRTRPW